MSLQLPYSLESNWASMPASLQGDVRCILMSFQGGGILPMLHPGHPLCLEGALRNSGTPRRNGLPRTFPPK